MRLCDACCLRVQIQNTVGLLPTQALAEGQSIDQMVDTVYAKVGFDPWHAPTHRMHSSPGVLSVPAAWLVS